MSDELEAQVEKERKEIEDAPRELVATLQPNNVGSGGRCGWCGRFVTDLVLVEVAHGQERYKGVSCCGQRHTG